MSPIEDDVKKIFLALFDISLVLGTAPKDEISQRASIKCLESIAFYVESLSELKKLEIRSTIENLKSTSKYLENEISFVDDYWLGDMGVLTT